MRVRPAVSALIAAGFVLLGASAASAQTSTTLPPIPPIPVTGGQTATTTTAPASSGDGATAGASSGDLADTGLAADMLVPFGFALIGGGAVLQAAARRRPRNAYGLL